MSMSLRKAKVTLAAAVAFTGLTIWGVHFQQLQEREDMYQGVLRDDVRRKEKMEQRQSNFEESQQKRELYERSQNIVKVT